MGARSALETLQGLLASQHGMFTHAQAAQLAIVRVDLTRLVASGELERIVYGVYATPVAAKEPDAKIRANWLALDPDRTAPERLVAPLSSGVLSHTTAAGILGLGELDPDRFEVTLPHRYRPRRPEVIPHRAVLHEDEVTVVDDLPVTTRERTLADLQEAQERRARTASSAS